MRDYIMSNDKFLKASAWLAIVSGVVAAIIGFIGVFIGESKIFSSNRLLDLLVVLMGLLCAGLGAERLGPLEKLLTATQNIERLRWLNTTSEIY